MSKLFGKKEIKERFNEDMFDLNVSKEITSIHSSAKIKTDERKYEKWLSVHLEHLENMYRLTGLSCDYEDFCNYVFDNSDV